MPMKYGTGTQGGRNIPLPVPPSTVVYSYQHQVEALAAIRANLATGSGKARGLTALVFSDKWSVVGGNNPVQLFNTIKGLIGASIRCSHSAVTTMTIAAANLNRVELIWDFGATVITHSSEVSAQPMFVAMKRQQSFYSTAAFVITPFIVVLENGETITSHDDNGTDVKVAIEGSLPAQDYALALGPSFASKGFMDNGTRRHQLEMEVNLPEVANWFSRYYGEKEIDELTSKVVQLGFCVSGVASQQVSFDNHTFYGFYQKARII
jgi:hypothetical protein